MQLKPANEVAISRTKTNREATPIEKAMTTALLKIANNIRQEFFQPLGYQLFPEQLIAMDGVNNVVRDSIRASTQGFYLLGTQYVNDANKTNMIITERDAQNIKEISNGLQASFYYHVVKWINRDKQIQQMEATGIPVGAIKHLDIQGAIERITNVASTKGINYGTVDKLLQLRNQPKIIITQYAAKVPLIQPRGRPTINPSGVKQKELKLFAETIVGTLVQWVTAEDDLVCDDCFSLGMTDPYDSTDPSMPIPPDDVHPNCRCRLFIVDPNIALQDVYGYDVEVLAG